MSNKINTVSEEGTLFDDSNLDEMQKAENYKIAYRLMQNYWIVSFAASLSAAYWGSAADDRALSAMGFLACLLAILFRLEYSLSVSKKGVMSPKYAETMAKKGSLVCARRAYGICWSCLHSRAGLSLGRYDAGAFRSCGAVAVNDADGMSLRPPKPKGTGKKPYGGSGGRLRRIAV